METGERTPIFTNTYTTSEETDKQTYRSIRFVWRVAVFLLGAGFLGYFVYWFIRMLQWSALSGRPIYTESLFWICLSGFSIYGFLIVREILAPQLFARRQTKRKIELYGATEITIDAAFYADGAAFHNRASDARLELGYSAVHRLTETKDLFLIRTQQKQLIALSKDGFDGTDIPGFRTFMDQKCPNAKRRWKKAD